MADAAPEPLPQRPARARRPGAGAAPEEAQAKRGCPAGEPTAALTLEPDALPAPAEGEDCAATVAWREASPNYEYLDHTADIQLHAWGASVEEAFGWAALCMVNYMTPLAGFAAAPFDAQHELRLSGSRDMHTLLFHFLDELLFLFCTESFVARELVLGRIVRGDGDWTLRVTARGSRFVPGTHEQGTEVKAITYSAMQVLERAPGEAGTERKHPAELFVIVDI